MMFREGRTRWGMLGAAALFFVTGCASRVPETELGETSFRGGFPVTGDYAPVEGSTDTALPMLPPGTASTPTGTGTAGAPAPAAPPPVGEAPPPSGIAGTGGTEAAPTPTTDPTMPPPATAGAPGTLTLSFTTVNLGGRYQPRNVGAVWIENGSGGFVKTLARWAGVRAVYLRSWAAASGGWSSFFGIGATPDELDAVSTATLRTAELHSLTWDMIGNDGVVVPDGKYTVKIEVTDDEIRPSVVGSVSFDKGLAPVQLAPPDASPYTGLTLSYTP